MSDTTPNIQTRMGSERNFGFVFTGAFSVLAVWSWLGDGPLVWPAAAAAVATLAVTLIRPGLLHAANALWFRFGTLLHAIISPLMMLVIYTVAFLPFGLVFRLLGKDPLCRAIDREADSYWISRTEQPGRMTLQF